MALERTVWQISGGPASRSYADVFLRHGVGLIGPGDSGPWTPDRGDEDFGDGQGAAGGFVRRFATELKAGDVVLLRTGVSRVRAVGLVASDYLYLNQFDDVNGWDLQHARRIRWCELPADYDFGSSVFGANPPRISRAASDQVIDYARRFVASPPTYWQEVALPALPPEEPSLDEAPGPLRNVIAEVLDLHALMWDRERFGEHPTEDELVSHFVVPLLRALGWPPERIAVKWRYVDVALFRSLPRIPANCHLVIEAKRLGAGVEGALDQAKGYVQTLGVPLDIVVTDGVRYRMYGHVLGYAPVAYANLVRLKRSAITLFNRLKRP
jgi:hypothetical protein